MRLLGQAALDFFVTYGWAIVVIAIVMGFMYFFVALPSSSAPDHCTFNYFVTCKAMAIGSNATNTTFSILMVNSQRYMLIGANIIIRTDVLGNFSNDYPCIPANAYSGNSILCNASSSYSIPVGSKVSGTIELLATVCPSGNPGNCQPAQNVTYIGNFSEKVQPVPHSLSWP